MGETSGYFVDPRSAEAVLKVLCKVLQLDLDFAALESKAQEIDRIATKIHEAEQRSSDSPGPGAPPVPGGRRLHRLRRPNPSDGPVPDPRPGSGGPARPTPQARLRRRGCDRIPPLRPLDGPRAVHRGRGVLRGVPVPRSGRRRLLHGSLRAPALRAALAARIREVRVQLGADRPGPHAGGRAGRWTLTPGIVTALGADWSVDRTTDSWSSGRIPRRSAAGAAGRVTRPSRSAFGSDRRIGPESVRSRA